VREGTAVTSGDYPGFRQRLPDTEMPHGRFSCTWDGRDANDTQVSDGKYILKVVAMNRLDVTSASVDFNLSISREQ
jgi:flagellar hook assembly protein FlgD